MNGIGDTLRQNEVDSRHALSSWPWIVFTLGYSVMPDQVRHPCLSPDRWIPAKAGMTTCKCTRSRANCLDALLEKRE